MEARGAASNEHDNEMSIYKLTTRWIVVIAEDGSPICRYSKSVDADQQRAKGTWRAG